MFRNGNQISSNPCRPGDGWDHAATDMLHHINGTLDTAIRGGWVNYGRYIL